MDLLRQIWFWVEEVGWAGFFDIGLIGLLIYTVLIFLKRTRQAAFVATGILILAGIYLAALKAGLVVTAWLLQAFFAVLLFTLVVIFQEELRYFFEQIARLSLRHSRRDHRNTPPPQRREVDVLIRTLTDLAQARIGALVVLRGRDLILRHLDGGEELHGKLSESILKSIFDPHSLGHDGAVIIERDRIDRLGVHLPLSKNQQKLHGCGTRHAAALGLSELCDALCLVVSEERGTISMARYGELRPVADAAELTRLIDGFYEQTLPQTKKNLFFGFFRQNFREKVIALLIAAAMWWAVGYRPVQDTRDFMIPVQIRGVDSEMHLAGTEPARVRINFAGARVFLKFLSADDIQLELNVAGYEPGEHVLPISAENLRVPGDLKVREIRPTSVRVQLQRNQPAGEVAP